MGAYLLKLSDNGSYHCGSFTDFSIPGKLINIISMAITIIQIAVPLLLIIFGMLDLGKAVMAQKEDEIKKGQQTFLKRLLAAAIVFFVVVIVKLVIGLVADSTESKNITGCIDCFINGDTKSCK